MGRLPRNAPVSLRFSSECSTVIKMDSRAWQGIPEKLLMYRNQRGKGRKKTNFKENRDHAERKTGEFEDTQAHVIP